MKMRWEMKDWNVTDFPHQQGDHALLDSKTLNCLEPNTMLGITVSGYV
jgi:hypothetical protein